MCHILQKCHCNVFVEPIYKKWRNVQKKNQASKLKKNPSLNMETERIFLQPRPQQANHQITQVGLCPQKS